MILRSILFYILVVIAFIIATIYLPIAAVKEWHKVIGTNKDRREWLLYCFKHSYYQSIIEGLGLLIMA